MVIVTGPDSVALAEPCLESLDELYSAHPALLEGARRMAAAKARVVRPDGVLYARQKEFVVSHRGDRFDDDGDRGSSDGDVSDGGGGTSSSSRSGSRIRLLGTDDVLTCHVVVLSHPFTGTVALAHFDEWVRERGLKRFLDAFLRRVRERYFSYGDEEEEDGDDGDDDDYEWEEAEEEDEVERHEGEEAEALDFALPLDEPVVLHLVGGYADEAGKAAKLSRKIFRFFHDLGADDGPELRGENVFHLETCCLGKPNSKDGKYYRQKEPVVGGVCVDISTGVPAPARFNRCFLGSGQASGDPFSPEPMVSSAGLDEETLKLLLLGPSLVPRPERLKKMIKQQEDKGYSSSSRAAAHAAATPSSGRTLS